MDNDSVIPDIVLKSLAITSYATGIENDSNLCFPASHAGVIRVEVDLMEERGK